MFSIRAWNVTKPTLQIARLATGTQRITSKTAGFLVFLFSTLARLDSAAISVAVLIQGASLLTNGTNPRHSRFTMRFESEIRVVTPGRYLLRLAPIASDRHTLLLFDLRDWRLILTVTGIPAYRTEVTPDTALTFWEVPAGYGPPLKSWFYPVLSRGPRRDIPRTWQRLLPALLNLLQRKHEPQETIAA
jgi:hypothetical protein